MFICHEKKFIFFHIPKTGGSSFIYGNRAVLGIDYSKPPPHKDNWHSDGVSHSTYLGCKKVYCDPHPDYFKFAFVRNPWSRMFSYYCGCIVRIPRIYGNKPTPDGFAYHLKKDIATSEKAKLHACKPQMDWLCDKKGNMVLDYVARFENYEKEFFYLMEKLNIDNYEYSHVNTSASVNLDYHDFYNQEIIDLVATKQKKDIDFFGYTY